MTFPPDPGRGDAIDDVQRAVALLVAAENTMLDSDDPWMHRALVRVGIAIGVLEPIR
jgi:hypothetical protein